ncbi:lysylphosphatidylglycerol synthase transmembrane domain-containing protein [Methanolobus sp.]|uniref:lysylphosphatidylglycerol synthase transmembrane domain-containing protein n=1 Tax=Methanolobus sp. TaxID=1874737 RepID=UPI0025E727E0|nr:lysylphosphatidylglycerol synthase transmembrane domain-containing protein [Methanolobus sp.]
MTKKIVSTLFAIIITVVLVAVLFSQINAHDIFIVIKGIGPISLLIGFILYSFSYVFRSLRFYFLLNKEIGIKDLFEIICVHNMANNVLPARTGELSFVYLLKKLHNRTIAEGVVLLTMARVFDLIAVSLMFFVSVYEIKSMSTEIMDIVLLIALFMFSLIITLVLLIYSGTTFSRYVWRLFAALRLDDNDRAVFVLSKITHLMENFDKIKKLRKIVFIELILSSLGVWLSMYFFNYVLVNAMNIHMSYSLVVFATSFAIFTTILPIQGIGGFGTLEGGWVIGFVAAGLTKEVAISSGFSYHIIILVYFLILGGWGSLMLKLKDQR